MRKHSEMRFFCMKTSFFGIFRFLKMRKIFSGFPGKPRPGRPGAARAGNAGNGGGDHIFISKIPGSGPSKTYAGPLSKRSANAQQTLSKRSTNGIWWFDFLFIFKNAAYPVILAYSGVITPKVLPIDTGKSGKTSAFRRSRQP